MANLSNKKTRLAIGGVDATTFARSATIAATVGTSEATTLADGGIAYIPALRDATLSAEAIATTDSVNTLRATAAAAAKQIITLAPAGGDTGNPCTIMQADTTSIEVSASSGEIVAVSIEASASGGANTGVVLIDGTGPAGNVDNGAATSAGAIINIHLFTLDAGEATIAVQHSTDAITWVDLATATFTAAGAQTFSTGGTVHRYTKAVVSYDDGGTTSTQLAAISRN